MQAWRTRAKTLKLTDQQIAAAVDNIAHLGDGEILVRHKHGFTAAEITDMMLDHNYERCPRCRWFVEVSELLDDNSEPKPCDQCIRR